MKEWILHLNLALGRHPKHIEKITPGDQNNLIPFDKDEAYQHFAQFDDQLQIAEIEHLNKMNVKKGAILYESDDFDEPPDHVHINGGNKQYQPKKPDPKPYHPELVFVDIYNNIIYNVYIYTV